MSLDAINKDDYGYTIELTMKDTDTDTASDISAYSTSQHFVLKSPSDVETTHSASFKTDGSDGVVEYTVSSGDIDAAGTWHIRIKAASGSAMLRSEWKAFEVGY